MRPKNADRMANSVDPDQTVVWVYTVCPNTSVRKLRIIYTVHVYIKDKKLMKNIIFNRIFSSPEPKAHKVSL